MFFYVVIDSFGFIGAFTTLELAKEVINKYENIPLMIIQYPMHHKSQKEFVYFLPWKFGENEGGPPAIVSNDRVYVLHLQTQLLALNLTLPDSLLFFTKKINKIDRFEMSRLHPADNKLYKQEYEQIFKDDQKEESIIRGGVPVLDSCILNREYGMMVDLNKKEENDEPVEQHIDNDKSNDQESENHEVEENSQKKGYKVQDHVLQLPLPESNSDEEVTE